MSYAYRTPSPSSVGSPSVSDELLGQVLGVFGTEQLKLASTTRAYVGGTGGVISPDRIGAVYAADFEFAQNISLYGSDQFVLPSSRRAYVEGPTRTDYTPIMGRPKTAIGNFRVPTNYIHDVIGTLSISGYTTRSTLEGTANLVMTDDFGTRSRIVLAGRGF